MEWLTRRIIWTLLAVLFTVGIVVAIWEALPGIIKILAALGIVFGFLKIIKK